MSADEVEDEGEEDEEEEKKNRVPESERRKVGWRQETAVRKLELERRRSGRLCSENEGRKEGSLEPLKSAPR